MLKITEEETKKILPLKGPSFTEVKKYLNKYNNEYIVIKCGGSVLVDKTLFENFINLSGDRRFSEDEAVIAGFAKFEERSVLVIGQEKGEDLDSRLKRNFGMMRPEGYRKCIRLMKLADKFNIPIISSITLKSKRSFADSFIAFAASSVFFGSLQSIVAHPSGEITE